MKKCEFINDFNEFRNLVYIVHADGGSLLFDSM